MRARPIGPYTWTRLHHDPRGERFSRGPRPHDGLAGAWSTSCTVKRVQTVDPERRPRDDTVGMTAPAIVPRRRLASDRRQTLTSALWLALIPGAVLFAIMQIIGYRDDNAIGVDSHAYWLAANFPDTWYLLPPSYQDAYLYSPAFAQALWPMGKLPWGAFQILWALIGAALAFWLLKPLGWRRGLTVAPFLVTELLLGNVYLFFAASLVLAVTRSASYLAFPLLTKVFPGVVALWFVARREWRPVAHLTIAVIAIVGVSAAINPAAWIDWLTFLQTSAGTSRGWFAGLRLALAAIIVIFAGRTGRAWLLAPALILACPVLGGWSPACVLAAVPRLRQWEREQRAVRPVTESTGEGSATLTGL